MSWATGASKLRAVGLVAAQRVTDEQAEELVGGIEAASPEAVQELSTKLNAQLASTVSDPAAASWFKLFNKIDEDGSGKISFTCAATASRSARAARPCPYSQPLNSAHRRSSACAGNSHG